MTLRMPMYYKEFRCIADRCKDNCCKAGWEIDIDDKTAGYYRSLNDSFGKKLKAGICWDNPKTFILDKNGSCPFLNDNNLCSVFINLGEDKMCQICSDHPRYYEWFDDIQEGGIGLCCEEASRIILSQTEPLTFWDREVETEECDEYDKALYECLYKARNKIFLHLQNKNLPLKKRLCDILDYAELLQYQTDNYIFDVPEIESNDNYSKAELKDILKYFLNLEYLNEIWLTNLKSQIEMYDKVTKSRDEFKKANTDISRYLENIAVYFVWRYFLKGVFDGEFLSRIKFMVISIGVIKYMFNCHWIEKGSLSLWDCIEIVKNYSQEIEYSEENMNAIADDTYQKNFFSTAYIKGIFR